MGKQNGFMTRERKESGYRPVKQRLADFAAVEKHLSERDVVCQASRCMDCGVPFCHGVGCPLSNVIPEWNDLIYRKKWHQALQLLISTSSFPEFTARICPALCEGSCVLGINDEPVTIRQIELFIIEKGFQEGWITPRIPVERNRKKVAVIGSGPAGLSVAHELNRIGFNVTVYEKDKYAGGILRYGIPDFKLEKWVLDRRISLMKEEGIYFETRVKVGSDISPKYLLSKFHAVCLAGGARQPRDLDVPGREQNDIHFAMTFLVQQNKLLAGEKVSKKNLISARNKNVVVIGGGDTGSDCVGTALRQKAKSVTQIEILPKPPIERSETTPWPEWPYQLRTSSSHKEGCKRLWNVLTTSFAGAKGKLTALNCKQVEWETDEAGKFTSFNTVEKTDFKLKADLALISMGFTGSRKDEMIEKFGVSLDGRGNVKKNQNHMTNIKGVFSAGDMAKGASLVVSAIADGRKTARGIAKYLSKGP